MWPEKNGKTFRIRDEVDGRKVTVESGFATKTAAKQRIVILKAEQLSGTAISRSAADITLADWWDKWWPDHKTDLAPSTVHKQEERWRLHIRPLLGTFTLRELDDDGAEYIPAWVAMLQDPDEELEGRNPLSAKTIACCHGLLSSMLKAASTGRARRMRWNPCRETKLPEIIEREQRYLTEPEIARLIAAMPKRYRVLVLLLVTTGLRIGEALALRVKHVDLLARRLRVERTLGEVGGELVEGTPKSKRSRRTVTYPERVALALAPLCAGRGREERVFTALGGGDLRQSKIWKWWGKTCADAGLEGLRVHDLRHTHAAQLIADNVSPVGISRRLGHASITVTMDTYGHLMEWTEEAILAATERSIELIDFRGILGDSAPEPPGTGLRSTELVPAQRG